MFDYDQYGSAFVDMRLHRLRVLITEQSDDAFHEQGIAAPSTCVSVLLFLQEKGSGSIAQIAEALGYSHQLIAHRLRQLDKAGFTRRFTDARDKRKWQIKLTAKGKREVLKIEATLPLIAEAFDTLFAQFSVDLPNILKELNGALMKVSLDKRIKSGSLEHSSPGGKTL